MAGPALLDLVYPVDTRDRTWMPDGLCRKNHPDTPAKAWSCDESEKVVIAGATVTAYRAQKAAVGVCFSCPAQWDCARFAVEGAEECGVWGMIMRDLRWLLASGLDGVALIEGARKRGVPVQVMVGRLRTR